MKNMSKKKLIVIILIAIIIIAGITITLTKGLNYDLRYQDTKRVELYLGKDFKIADIKQITDEVLPDQAVLIQKIEVYEDSISIISKDITDEQRTNLVNKVNEKYETELNADDIETTTIPHTRGRDIVKPYILPFIIATVIILAYMAVRYHKLGSIKTVLKIAGICILAQIILLSVIAITRIPVGRLTIPMVITVYILTLVGLTTKFEKDLTNNKKEEK